MSTPLALACLGGGQLGRMMALEANRMITADGRRIAMSFLDPAGPDCPAGQVVPSARIARGSLHDAEAISKLVEGCDVLTVELEHVHVAALEELQASHPGLRIRPSPSTLKIIHDKLVQKNHFAARGIDLPPFCDTPSVDAIRAATAALGTPLMLKTRRGGYDGRGNAVLKSESEADVIAALAELDIADMAATDLDVYAEGWIDFAGEVAVMVVRSADGSQTLSYPAVDAIQQDSICRVVLAPSRRAVDLQRCEELARNAVASLGDGAVGAFGVELFVTKSGDILLNEVAPRPHNTGHYTQNACHVNQFENHVRAVCGMPLGNTEMMVPAAGMVNILGSKSTEPGATHRSSAAALSMPSSCVHWYGKAECREGRKMGHINVTGNSTSQVDEQLKTLLELEGVPLDSVPFDQAGPSVGIIMGSHSDLPTMDAAVQVMKEFGVSYHVDIVSAHRTPEKLMDYSRSAAARGLRVIIAGAGGAAHLPGMVAAMTPLPVIGVPVKTSTLSGVDSLYSIVQMPRGVPVATVAIGNAMNAGLLAVRMLGSHDKTLLKKMEAYQTKMKEAVDANSEKLVDMGSDAFLAQMDQKNKSVNV